MAVPWKGFIVVDTGIFVSIRKDISHVLDQEQAETLMGSVGKRTSVVMAELDDELRQRIASGVAINQHQHIANAMAKSAPSPCARDCVVATPASMRGPAASIRSAPG